MSLMDLGSCNRDGSSYAAGQIRVSTRKCGQPRFTYFHYFFSEKSEWGWWHVGADITLHVCRLAVSTDWTNLEDSTTLRKHLLGLPVFKESCPLQGRTLEVPSAPSDPLCAVGAAVTLPWSSQRLGGVGVESGLRWRADLVWLQGGQNGSPGSGWGLLQRPLPSPVSLPVSPLGHLLLK